MEKNSYKAGLIAVLLLCPMLTQARPLLTITCHDAKGSTIHYGVPFWEQTQARIDKKPLPRPHVDGPKNDGYDNTITIVIDSASPTKITVVWNDSAATAKTRADAKKIGMDMIPPQVDEGVIVSSSPGMFSAVVDAPPQAIALYTFYPKQGTAFITTHSRLPNDTDTALTAVRAACEYQGNADAIRFTSLEVE